MVIAEGGSVPSGVGYGEGCPLSSRLKGLGERRELPQRGPGQSTGRKRILAYFEGHRTLIFVPIWQNLWGQFALASPAQNSGGLVPLPSPWSTPMVPAAALHTKAQQVKWPGWQIQPSGFALLSPAYCFALVMVWTENLKKMLPLPYLIALFYFDGETALAAYVLRATTKKGHFRGKVHPGDLAGGFSDLEMTWLLYCAGAGTGPSLSF